MDFEKILELLKSLPDEIVEYLVFELMVCGKLSFTQVAEQHNKYIEMLKNRETDDVMKLRGKLIHLWGAYKKDVPQLLVSYIQEAKDEGWINISQEEIDNSKWNK